MINLITGAIAVLLVIVFLGFYAVKLNTLPLWIIIAGILCMVIADFVLSLRAARSRDKPSGEDGAG